MKILLCLGLMFLISCQQEQTPPQEQVAASSSEVSQQKDFSDLEQKDESCDTQEDLEKKIMEEAKKKPEQAFKLQGGDSGCSTK